MTADNATPPESEAGDEEIVLDEQIVAAAVLTSEQSWEVLEELYAQASKRIVATSWFVNPVVTNIASLREKLNDPIGFEKSFNTLMADIRATGESLKVVYEQHAGRSGVPEEEDWPTVFSTSQDYNTLINRFESTIDPLIDSLMDIIKNEHGELYQQMVEATPQTEETV